MKQTRIISLFLIFLCSGTIMAQTAEKQSSPCIVNFVNFIRGIEPRDENFTDEYLFQTTANQLKQLDEYNFPGTFLIQYDALIMPAYQELLKRAIVK